MAAGAAAFDELVPGWRKELVALGAVPFDASADAVLRLSQGWLPRTRSGIITYACSRALIEMVLLRSLAGISAVRVLEHHQAVGLLSTPRGERVTGVRAIKPGRGEIALLAELVVDASGAGSILPRWIASLSKAAPSQLKKIVVKSGMQYVSRWFRVEPRHAPDWHCLSIAPTPSTRQRAAMMLRAERDLWGAVLLAPAGEALPDDDAAFLDFASCLGCDELRAVLARARPASPIHRYGPTLSRMTACDRLPSWPMGLIALGDSVCALDPYFGLGMTAAARGAVLLATCLDQEGGTAPLGGEFQQKLAALNAQPWQLATGRHPDGRPLTDDTKHLDRVYEAALSRPEVAHGLLAVQHLLRPAETLREIAA
jgi:2-polyprenyl-6-methoxyphenol hydroxylase-like FAD-dependent oxidoreductase